MTYQMPGYNNTCMGPQAMWGNQQYQEPWFQPPPPPPPPQVFQKEIQRLNFLLEMEQAKWFEEHQKVAYLEAELDETQFQLRRNISLKDMYIRMGKETKNELEAIKKCTSPETLNYAAIASKMLSDVNNKSRKMLQKDFEELTVAHVRDQEELKSQIQAEKQKNNALQEELNKIKASYEDFRHIYEDDVADGTHQAEIQVCEERIREDKQLLENLRAEKDEIHQKMSQEITFLKEREKCLQKELDQVKVSYQELNLQYEKDVSALKQQAEAYQKEVEIEKKANSERAKTDLQQINKLRAEKMQLHEMMSQEIQILQTEIHLPGDMDQSEKDNSDLRQQVERIQLQIIKEKKAHLATQKKDLMLLNKLKAEQDNLQENMSREITVLVQKEKYLQSELDKMKTSYQNLNSRYETDVSGLKQQAETFRLERKVHLETTNKNLQLINNLRAEKANLQQQIIELATELENQSKINKEVFAELKGRDDLGEQERHIVRWKEQGQQTESIRVKNIFDPACIELDNQSKEPPQASRESDATAFPEKNTPEKKDNADIETMKRTEDATKPKTSTWEMLKQCLGSKKKPKTGKKDKNKSSKTS